MKPLAKFSSTLSLKEVQIHALSHDGRGIASVNGKTTFIDKALPEETVHYRLLRKHPNYDDAEMTELLTPAKDRTTPVCEHFELCGGCSLQHMSNHLQIMLKEQTLLDQLKHIGKTVPENILAPLSCNTEHYRRKARLGVKFVIKKNKMLVGFREKKSRYLADLAHCVVLHPKVGENFGLLSELVLSLSIYEHIPQIEIAIGDETCALVFRHMHDLTEEDKLTLIAFAEKNHFHIYLQPNSPQKISKLYPADDFERLTYSLPDYDLTFQFHPLDFTQINLEINRLMVKQALRLLDLNANDRVLDLFCGIGNFTLPIAKHAAHVVGVEGSDDMVDRAYENAARNNIDNVQFFTANLMEKVSANWATQHYDKILIDPARAGAKEILPLIAKMAAKKIVYVSCNPATLARDTEILVHEHGYKLISAGIMNMFPHTSHIEAMAVFEK